MSSVLATDENVVGKFERKKKTCLLFVWLLIFFSPTSTIESTRAHR